MSIKQKCKTHTRDRGMKSVHLGDDDDRCRAGHQLIFTID